MKNTWLNLAIDVTGFSEHCFRGATHRAIDGVAITAHCKLRRVFTMRGPLLDVNEESPTSGSGEKLPKSVEYPVGVAFCNQVYTVDKVEIDNSEEGVPELNAAGVHIEPGKTTTKAAPTQAFSSNPLPTSRKVSATGTSLGAKSTRKTKKKSSKTLSIATSAICGQRRSSTHESLSVTQNPISVRSKARRTTRKVSDSKADGERPNKVSAKKPRAHKKRASRDTSEPPRLPLGNRQGSNVPTAKRAASKSPLRIFPEPRARGQRQFLYDQSTDSIQEQEEDENNSSSRFLKKSGSQLVVRETCAGKKQSSAIKPKKSQPKPRARRSLLKSKTPIANSNPKPQKTPRKTGIRSEVQLLQQAVGGTQLNSFKIPGLGSGEVEEEIEEDIEGDRQSSDSDRESEAGARDATPLYHR